MSRSALAPDAVSIRRVRSRGVPEVTLRRQLAAVPTPPVRRFVFVRRVTLHAEAQRIGLAMQAALAKLAEDDRQEVLTFVDFPALAVACARAAFAGGLGAWHWRTLGLPPSAGPGEAVPALLAAHPLEAGSAVAALAAAGLLAPIWRDMSEAAAVRLTASLAAAAGFAVLDWPVGARAGRAGGSLPAPAEALLARAAAAWSPVLARLPPRSEAVRTAAVLSLLRWSPGVLRAADNPVWPALLMRLAGRTSVSGVARANPVPEAADDHAVAAPRPAAPATTPRPRPDPAPRPATKADGAAFGPADSATTAAPPSQPHGQVVATGWGGVLFLINALQRFAVDALLAAAGPEAPSGWRLLYDLGAALGLPVDEPLAHFLAAQDLDTTVPPHRLAALVEGIEALYRPDGPWPLPLAQPALLRATETHLDLDLAATTIDLALRLSGLDLNPGWVPWLGRVVTFHYDGLPTYRRPGG